MNTPERIAMNREFIQYDDMEPGDLCRKLDRPPSHEFPYTHQFVTVDGANRPAARLGLRQFILYSSIE